jgi:hypothetical protein
MESPETGTSLIAVTVGGAGGMLGTLAAVAVKPPKSRREAWVRVVVGLASAFAFTGIVCQTCGVHPAKYELTLGVGFSIGFGGWAILGTISALLASVRTMAEARGIDSVKTLAGIAGDATRALAGSVFGIGKKGEKDDRNADK